jgi:hypothetical protein
MPEPMSRRFGLITGSHQGYGSIGIYLRAPLKIGFPRIIEQEKPIIPFILSARDREKVIFRGSLKVSPAWPN